MSLRVLNPNAEVLNKSAALHMNINAAKGLQDVLKTNLGPKGTIKMLVGGAGDLKLTKDGNTLLKEMQIQNPTAIMIARTAVAQDDTSGDGTTSTVLFIGELMKQSSGALMKVLTQDFWLMVLMLPREQLLSFSRNSRHQLLLVMSLIGIP